MSAVVVDKMLRYLTLMVCLLLAVVYSDARYVLNKHKVAQRNELEITCDDGYQKCPTQNKCIRSNYFCDGDNDCGDNSDEPATCQTMSCPDGALKCKTGQCIQKDLFCSGSASCRDGTQFPDVDCPSITCDVGQTKCPHISKCIQSTYFCDGDNDCGDRSDEPDDCATRSCPDGTVKCNNGQCIDRNQYCSGSTRCKDSVPIPNANCPPITCEAGFSKCPYISKCIQSTYFCDGDNDCGDRSDEPDDCRTRSCPDGTVKCNSGRCITTNSYCFGGCFDDTFLPEVTCPSITCDHGYVQCPRLSKCIKSSFVCDGDNDCKDKSDEPSDCAERLCHHHEFRCNNGQCLNRTSYCLDPFAYSCKDSTDMSSICTDVECPAGYAKCVSDGRCIESSRLCNAVNDCSDSSDESVEHCSSPIDCPLGEARCPKVRRCINSRYLCDTDNDCGDNSDEDASFCSSRVCQPDEVRCNNGQCVEKDGLCRGSFSCRDGSFSSSSDICGPHSGQQPHPGQPIDQLPSIEMPFSAECVSAMLRFQLQCAEPPKPHEIFETTSEEDIYNKFLQVDLREVCSPYVRWFECANDTFSACTTVSDPTFASYKQIIAIAGSVLNYVCVQEVDVLNRHKACLLRVADGPEEARSNHFQPILADSLHQSCQDQLRLVDQLPQPFCSLQGVQSCAKPIIAEQCGDEIAAVIAGIVDRVHSAAECPSSRLRSTTHIKRRGFSSYAHSFKFLKSLF